jgi:glycosyltransferase involved in cell wall biosynthesis
MLRRLYYTLKPYLPWRLRMALRRLVSFRIRQASKPVWPIDESAARPPADWPGWPEGKKFAFVITHDVEGPRGLGRCRQLAVLEMAQGVRSSFNLIPEGSYDVPPELRAWLREHGFEVGVHDLQHDGKLYQSRRGFEKKAARINFYLRDWGAAGFRSGFMLRNLDWLHALNVRYDSSTFDTDPFEPQSDGAGTIFPYWIPVPEVPRGTIADTTRDHAGYIELPYTLPQDSTLFLVLREKSPEIWKRKLDWVARHGGMALINVHPDYIDFSGRGSNREYAASLYSEFLQFVSAHYAGQFWNPLPGALAEWFDQTRSKPAKTGALPLASDMISSERLPSEIAPVLQRKRAAVLLYSNYPSDPRPRRAAEAMIEAGMNVDLLCLLTANDSPRKEQIKGVNVFRTKMIRRRGGKVAYFLQYGRFFCSSLWFLTWRGLRHKYDVVHVHNMPDFLVFAALIPRLRGARIILDLHDPMPELMTSIYALEAIDWRVRLLRRLERWSIGFSQLALTPNIAFKTLFASRSCRAEKVQIVMNSPEERIFRLDATRVRERAPDDGEFRIMHHGLIAHRHGVDLLVEAVARVREVIPGVQLHIYGAATPFLETVLEVARRLEVSDRVHYHGSKSQLEIARAIQESDLGMVPNRHSSFTELNFPTRIFEYLALNCPVIAPATKGITDYFRPDQLLMFEPGNPDDLVAKILWAKAHPEALREIARQGANVYRQHLWKNEKIRFINAVASLHSGRAAGLAKPRPDPSLAG